MSVYCDQVRWKVWSANFYLSVAARTIVWADPSLRYIACCWDDKQATNKLVALEQFLPSAQGRHVLLNTTHTRRWPAIWGGCRPSSTLSILLLLLLIAFKGAIRDFLQSPHSAANLLQHVRSSGPGAIVCKSRATHRALITCKCHVTCHLVQRDSSAIKFDRVEIAFIWALFYWLNHQTDEGGEETGVSGENPRRRASENATYYSPKIQAPSETRTRAVALVVG